MKILTALFFVLLLNYSMIQCFGLMNYQVGTIKGKLAQMMVEIKTGHVKTFRVIGDGLRDMMNKLQEEQTKHEETSKQMMQQCEDEDKFREKEVADAKDALSRATEARDKSAKSKQDAEELKPKLEDTSESSKKELAAKTAERKAAHEQFLKTQSEYQEAIKFLKAFLEYVELKFQGDVNVKTVFAQFSEKLLIHASRLNVLGKAVPLLVTLAQAPEVQPHNNYHYTSNTDVKGSLIDAIKSLTTQLETDLQTLVNEENAAQEAFQKYETYMKQFIESVDKHIETLKKQIDDMLASINSENSIIALASAKLERNTKLKVSASKMCEAFTNEFIKATKNRFSEIQTIKEILEICRKKFSGISKDLIDYLESVKNGFLQYQNSTEFKRFEEYNKHHIDNNVRGEAIVNGQITD